MNKDIETAAYNDKGEIIGYWVHCGITSKEFKRKYKIKNRKSKQ